MAMTLRRRFQSSHVHCQVRNTRHGDSEQMLRKKERKLLKSTHLHNNVLIGSQSYIAGFS